MSIFFEKIDNELYFNVNGEKHLCDKSGGADEYEYILEALGGDDYLINEMVDISTSDYPDGLFLYDLYKSENFSKMTFIELKKISGILKNCLS